jgi:hypothetical protein
VTDDPVGSILAEASRISEMISGTTWYLFGSMLTNARHANDIDLLVIHERADDGPTLRAELTTISATIPLDLMIVSEDEEQALNVRGRYRLRQIFPGTSPAVIAAPEQSGVNE